MSYITIENGKLKIPDKPTIGYIEGDGIGPDITTAMIETVNGAIEVAYGGSKSIEWEKIQAGEEAYEKTGKHLPEQSMDQLSKCVISIKGPLTTPIGKGFRSLNVTLRQHFDLYANVRPVKYFPGVPSPVTHPENMNMVVFRENTEDLYAGIEWKYDSEEAKKMRAFLQSQFNVELTDDTGIGIKPISRFKSQRLVRKAIEFAIANKRRSVTLVHKGNIMKYTEGAFKEWGYEVASNEFADQTVKEDEYLQNPDAFSGKIVMKDRIADNMFQQVLTRTSEYDVIATPNLIGDFLSDAIAAQVGGIGIAPGANIGDIYAIFEAVHGTAPKYAGMDIANPTSLILSGVMMLDHLGWHEAAQILDSAVTGCYKDQKVTQDLARIMNIKALKCSEFADEIIRRLTKV
ncbi:MAG: isocitrate dehydrogenase (NADP(+)) [Candidatus Thermoplasmatota archaeon]|jgi:isocitrate dehydrogenase|nr:isocitrate dehydrogenase (NADP(+)) [Candidatus Thermoplasmatota archaeon]MCL5790835.1 isocitrate dehydrogenase (NADP(+)) [Candidatus Thermoplasmatota archaeon]